MPNKSFWASVELYKRRLFDCIPIGSAPDGTNHFFHHRQIEALEKLVDKETFFIGYGGAARSGKTLLECYWQLFSAHAYPDTRYFIGRSSLVNIRRTVLQTFLKCMAFYGFKPGEDYKLDMHLNNSIRFANNSVIYLINTEYLPSDPLFTRFGGLEVTAGSVDESNETNYQAISTLFSRCGWWNNDKYGLKKKMLETFNPDKGHVYRRYYKPFTDNNLKDGYAFIKALPKDNPSSEIEDWIKDMIAEGDKIMIERLINGNFEYDDDPNTLIDYDAIQDMYTNSHVLGGDKIMTCDIAMQGSDEFKIYVWDGWRVIARYTYKKSVGKQIVSEITRIKNEYAVANSRIIYDADGVGAFIGGSGGFISGAKAFHNGSSPLPEKDATGRLIDKPNYRDLKTQCCYHLARIINSRNIWFKCSVPDAEKDKIEQEISQLKRWNADKDGKLQIKPKAEIKGELGRSPDDLDAIMMRSYADLGSDYKIRFL